MAEFDVIRDLSASLKHLLVSNLHPSLERVTVTVTSPGQDYAPEPRINIYLYRVARDQHRRDDWQPLGPGAGGPDRAPAPLPLRLSYLVTAFASDGLTEQRILGHAMQTLHRNQRLPEETLQGSLAKSSLRSEVIQVVLLDLEHDEISGIWGHNAKLQRASVAYEASLVLLGGVEEPTAGEGVAGSGGAGR